MSADSERTVTWYERLLAKWKRGDDRPVSSSFVSQGVGSTRQGSLALIEAEGFNWLDLDRKLTDDEKVRLQATGLNIPTHIGIIMDGNGRWAKRRGQPRTMGHRAGAAKLRDITASAARLGVDYLTVYAFSTENWGRPQSEVDQLMRLFIEFFGRYDRELAKEDIRLRFSGDIPGLPQDVQDTIHYAEETSQARQGLQLVIAFNYGGRQEIIDGIAKREEELRQAWQEGRELPALTTESFTDYLYLPDIPDPDLIIRSSGELRSSNFLLWESAYAEFWVSDVLWPDFTGQDLLAAVIDYNHRNRRFGKVE